MITHGPGPRRCEYGRTLRVKPVVTLYHNRRDVRVSRGLVAHHHRLTVTSPLKSTSPRTQHTGGARFFH